MNRRGFGLLLLLCALALGVRAVAAFVIDVAEEVSDP